MSFSFLTDEWITATRTIREEYRGQVQPGAVPALRANLVVTDVPFGEGTLDAHLDTSNSELEIELGHLANSDVTVTVEYVTAKKVFVEANLSAAMEGMQLGRIKVDGDMLKLMSLASLQVDPASREMAKKIQSITS